MLIFLFFGLFIRTFEAVEETATPEIAFTAYR